MGVRGYFKLKGCAKLKASFVIGDRKLRCSLHTSRDTLLKRSSKISSLHIYLIFLKCYSEVVLGEIELQSSSLLTLRAHLDDGSGGKEGEEDIHLYHLYRVAHFSE